jgi:Cu+-exporting ATPase
MATITSNTTTSSSYTTSTCYHCGEPNPNQVLQFDDKTFCCQGCMSVYKLLNQVGLCTYYELNDAAGINKRQAQRKEKFAYLDDEQIQQQLIAFKNNQETHIHFYIPYIHCSSCVYLLERLHLINEGVKRVDILFLKKEVNIIFNHNEISLRALVELLSFIGYEPHISLNQTPKRHNPINKKLIYRVGVAGFCFGNIMLLSFPEYVDVIDSRSTYLSGIFRYLNLLLSLPVFFYSAMEFFVSAWKGLRQKFINIDAPVSLAVITCFVRSVFDIISGTGAGYLDSMAGIVFFMLIGKILQEKTYSQLSFDRDYTNYFPIATSVVKENAVIPTPLNKVKVNDTLRIHNNELIPADGILVKGKAQIDYSFVTGESTPVDLDMGSIVYAGGKQLGADIEILTIKEVAQSYLTSIWNKNKDMHKNDEEISKKNPVHYIGKFFTLEILIIAFAAAGYWWYKGDYPTLWKSFTAVLIVACPCALLLTSTFTNGYILRILERNGIFLRTAKIIDPLGKLTTLVFDKTGTLTSSGDMVAKYYGENLSNEEQKLIASLTIPTLHPMAQPVKNLLDVDYYYPVEQFEEVPSLGVSGWVNGNKIEIGTASHLHIPIQDNIQATQLHIKINDEHKGYFTLHQNIRNGVKEMFVKLTQKIKCIILSGDNNKQQQYLEQELGAHTTFKFNCSPQDKLNYIKSEQANGQFVGMIGDGLNDAGALLQSNVGISVADDINSFTPAADAIIEGKKLNKLGAIILLCAKSNVIIKSCFIFSLIYNLTGVYFAVQGLLSPLIAAILMPLSTLTIVTITYTLSNVIAKRLNLE